MTPNSVRPTPSPAFAAVFSPFLNRATLRGKTAIAQMALDMQAHVACEGAVAESDLEILGWTRAQIATLGADARQHAIAESSRTVGVR